MIRVTKLISTFTHDQMTVNRIIRGGEVVLVVLLAISLARLAVDLIPSVPVSYNAANTSLFVPAEHLSLQAGQTQSGADRVSPALKQLFGKAKVTAITGEEVQQPLQQTSLNLVLKGILADRDSDNRLALVAVGGNKEQVYRVGDQIEGAEIIRIETRRIIIRRNGATEALDLEVRKLSGSTTMSANQDRVSFGTGIRKRGDNELVIPRSTLKQQMNNLPALLQQARAEPYSEAGKQVGFRIVDLQQGSVFQQLGIQQGDIIYSVNGTAIRSVEAALNAYRNLGSASSYRVGVLRGGQDISLNLSVE